MSAKPSLLAELKRRNVLRAAALYVSAAWALTQVIMQVGPVVSMPDWVPRWFLVATAIGFPFWIAFAWSFELTPAGVKREGEVVVDAAMARRTARKLDHWTFGVLALAVVLLLTDRFVVRGAAADAGAATTEQSVAVLPLANESGDSSNDYFVDGLSEQLISDLSRLESLRVIGRTSSFRFRGSKEDPAAIGAKLGVAHLIDGTVRQSGNRVKVVVGLVRATDGSSVWSQSYDREMKDIFAVQAEIAQAVAAALQVKLKGAPRGAGDAPPSGNVEAYHAVLKAQATARQGTDPATRQSIAYLEKAIRLDPDYALAHALMAHRWLYLGYFLQSVERELAYAEARRAADRALALDPDLPLTHVARANVLRDVDFDYVGSEAELSRALALAPGSAYVMYSMAVLLATVGKLEPAVALFRKVIATDPLHVSAYGMLSEALMAQGKLDEAEELVRTALALQPDFTSAYLDLTYIAILRNDAEAALQYAERERDLGPVKEYGLAAARQIVADRREADAALQTFIARYSAIHPANTASLYAIRREPDAMFEWLDRAWAARSPDLANMLYDPFILRYRDDPRFAALCKKLGLPVPGAE